MSSSLPFHGEQPCARDGCPNRAYFAVGGTILCGVHSKRDAASRRPLPKDPNASTKRKKLLQDHNEAALVVPLGAPRPGKIMCHRMLMMRTVPMEGRWLNVMPNRKAANRTDGVGMPALSPMLLGPVRHRQPGLPESLNIENYHQANKVWASELASRPPIPDLSDLTAVPPPSAEWYKRREAMYADPTPHRHKFTKEQMAEEEKAVPGQRNKNQAMYSVHLATDGTERRFSYVESRFFYCVAFEALAVARPEFKQLLEWHKSGVDIKLCGYDAYDMGVSAEADTLYAHYCDPTKPFGHERVLYALLMLSDSRDDLPWWRYRREHPSKYDGVAQHL